MTQFSVGSLLDELASNIERDMRPWGWMQTLHAPGCDITVKYLHVRVGQRTSLQQHANKDELLFILYGSGEVEVGSLVYTAEPERVIRIKPGMIHRVTGPLTYLEVSTYDDGTDTIRFEDDYGRTE